MPLSPGPIDLPPPPQPGQAIPRNLFRIAKDEASLAPALQANLAALAAANPGWQQKIWYDDEASAWVRATFPGRISQAFHRIAPAFGVCQADFLRYLLIWYFGGVYLDLKSGARQNLDQMIRPDDQYLVGKWLHPVHRPDLRALTGGEEFQQWFLAARPGHPFLAAVIGDLVARIETYRPSDYMKGSASVLKLTGPVGYTRSIVPILDQHPHRVLLSATEGWVYSVLDDPSRHRGLGVVHYSRRFGLHVLPPARPDLAWRMQHLLFRLVQALRRALGPLRQLNHRRLEQRRARQGRTTD